MGYRFKSLIYSFNRRNFIMKTTTLCMFGLLLIFAWNLEVRAYCETNGCGPAGLNPFLKKLVPFRNTFEVVCNKRDVCYACVSLYFVFNQQEY